MATGTLPVPAGRVHSWNGIIQALVLIRIGQELGTNTPFARALHDLLSAVLAFGG